MVSKQFVKTIESFRFGGLTVYNTLDSDLRDAFSGYVACSATENKAARWSIIKIGN